jgi:hypothetical protein
MEPSLEESFQAAYLKSVVESCNDIQELKNKFFMVIDAYVSQKSYIKYLVFQSLQLPLTASVSSLNCKFKENTDQSI